MTIRNLSTTAASLLGFLHSGPLTGWDLMSVAQQTIGAFWSLSLSQVYRELAAMAREGLVTAGEREARDRRPYVLTDAGRAAFVEWVDRDVEAGTIRFPLLVVVALGRHLPADRLAAVLARHRAIHAARLAEYDRAAAEAAAAHEPDPYARATLDFGVRQERAVLEWFDNLPPEISGDRPAED
jgi:DNA-binding PadR family transcriptional regulator